MEDFSKYIISDTAKVKEALIALNNLSNDIQTLFVVNNEKQMIGTITDGDVRRGLINGVSIEDGVMDILCGGFKYIIEGKIDVEIIKGYKSSGIELLPCLNTEKQIVKIYNLKQKKSVLPIDAVLMAGGKGERLRPLTEKTPKPLLPVGSKAIIDYNVDTLIEFGIEHISVTVNYLRELIEKHFETKRGKVKVKCVREPQFLGTLGSVKFVDTFYNDTVLVMNSDLFTNIDYEDFYMHFLKNEADMSVAVIPYSVTVPYGIFELEGRNILGIREKPSYNYYANAGIYLIKKNLLDLIPDNTFYNATDFMETLINKHKSVIRFPLTGYWIDIGKHEDYIKANELVKHL